MKLELINRNSVKELSNTELLSLHRRVHQLSALKNNQKNDLVKIHNILVVEIKRRKFQHMSDIKGDNTMKSNKIKILAMENVVKSKNLTPQEKIEYLNYIKEKASPHQCIGYILDGKFYNLNESGKKEIVKRFLKEQKI